MCGSDQGEQSPQDVKQVTVEAQAVLETSGDGVAIESSDVTVTQTKADAAHDALWAEFSRRRREDRERRKQQWPSNEKRMSEVQEIIAAVQHERNAGNNATHVATRTVGGYPTTPPTKKDGSMSGSPPRALSSDPRSLSPIPHGESEVQRLLAEVRRQRHAAGGNRTTLSASVAESPPAAPNPAPSPPSPLRLGKPASLSAAREAVKSTKQEVLRVAPVTSTVSATAKTRSCSGSSAGSPPKALRTRRGPDAGPTATLVSPRKASSVASKSELHLPRNSVGRRYRSGATQDTSSTPKRVMELGFDADPAPSQRWAAGLRRSSSCTAPPVKSGYSSASMSHTAYPSGSWDDRTSCAPLFSTSKEGSLRKSEAMLPPQSRASPRGRRSVAKRGTQPRHSVPWDSRNICPETFNGFLDLLGCTHRPERGITGGGSRMQSKEADIAVSNAAEFSSRLDAALVTVGTDFENAPQRQEDAEKQEEDACSRTAEGAKQGTAMAEPMLEPTGERSSSQAAAENACEEADTTS
eukprot:TRINITY_DN74871_c0_g1_i1.p1 TRINITY_DN74871_c0_g1~~TRINITY_DN74871_c0_g1_i1.p1  ORF type:complete len:524 (-),score=74.63 TRINITY_DN74871_c0_g1_i1:104-1675(-)